MRAHNERAWNENLLVSAGISLLRILAEKHVYTGLFTLCVCVCVCLGRLMCLCLLLWITWCVGTQHLGDDIWVSTLAWLREFPVCYLGCRTYIYFAGSYEGATNITHKQKWYTCDVRQVHVLPQEYNGLCNASIKLPAFMLFCSSFVWRKLEVFRRCLILGQHSGVQLIERFYLIFHTSAPYNLKFSCSSFISSPPFNSVLFLQCVSVFIFLSFWLIPSSPFMCFQLLGAESFSTSYTNIYPDNREISPSLWNERVCFL